MIEIPVQYLELESVYTPTLGSGLRSLVVTASQWGEGTSLLALALARRHAAAGHTTLLVDLNQHHPAVDAHFSLPRSEWLPAEPSAHEEILSSPHEHLQLLTASNHPHAPLRWREKELVKKTIEQWLEKVDAVVFDTSPLTALNRNNIPPEGVAEQCAGTVMVVAAGVTTDEEFHTAREQLGKATLSGVVFNDFTNPSLAQESVRETHRLDRLFPKTMASWRKAIGSSSFLNIPV